MWLIDQDSSITGSIEDSSFFFLTSKRLNYKLRRLKTRIILFKNPHHFVYDEE